MRSLAQRYECYASRLPQSAEVLIFEYHPLRVIGALIVTHGNLARELLSAAEKIEATLTGIEAVPLEWTDSVDAARDKISDALDRIGRDRGVIIFTDMFGGTPSNISLSFLEQGQIEIVTGVNLPMIVKFAMLQPEANDVSSLAHVISEKGSKAIRVASDLLAAAGTPAR
jgi:mannose PTS system EIIA component